MKIRFAIHKEINLSAQEIDEILISGHDVPGGFDYCMPDGWVIIDNEPNVEP